MKKFIIILFAVLAATAEIQAQAPQGFNFQGIALDSTGYVVASKLVSLRFSISTDSLGNLVSYRETASAQTDKYGQFTTVIGNGMPSIGRFSSIIWSSGSLYMKTEIDIANTGKYVVTGLSKLLSVPYALQATSAGNIASDTYGNTKAGTSALDNPKPQTTTGNAAFGDSALKLNVGLSNSAFGSRSLSNNYNGNYNTAIGATSLLSNTTGSSNIAVGYGSLLKNTTAYYNVAIGVEAQQQNQTGSNNVAIGNGTSLRNYKASNNTAIGNQALGEAVVGDNTAIGFQSLKSLVNGGGNTAIGYLSGGVLENGINNIFIGQNSGNAAAFKFINNRLIIQNDSSLTPLIYGEFDNKKLTVNGDLVVTGKMTGASEISSDAYGNTKAGTSALANNKLGSTSGTVAVGDSALKYNYGRDNTAIGSRSMQSKSISSGSANTAIGNSSLYSISQGSSNTASGVSSLYSNTNGSANTSTGYQSMYSNTIGYSNTAMGVSSLFSNTNGSRNTALGDSSMLGNTTGSFNTATGYSSLASNTTGGFNSAYGSYSMEKNTSGMENVAFGGEALRKNTTGSTNVAVGTAALNSNTTGGENTAIGRRAMNNNTTGTFNTAIGQAALYANTTGSNNTAVGRTSLVYNTGEGNTAFGATSITNNTNGKNNTGIGYYVLGGNITGSYNTAIGYNAGAKSTSGDKNIFIGNEAGNNFNFSAVSNKLVIDNSDRSDPLMVGDFSSRKLVINGDSSSKATLEIRNGDTYISNPNKGIILTSPSGACWRVTVDDAGSLVRTSVACPGTLSPKLGDVYQGGIIFYIDSTGEHGLITAASDQGSGGGAGWGCYCTSIAGLDSTLGSGSKNTAEIVRQCPNAGIAAKVCDALVLNGYSDWYLPSKLELDLMYTNLKLNGKGNFLTNVPYWSSTSASYGSCGATGGAWTKNFGTGVNIADSRSGYAGTGAIRAIRAF